VPYQVTELHFFNYDSAENVGVASPVLELAIVMADCEVEREWCSCAQEQLLHSDYFQVPASAACPESPSSACAPQSFYVHWQGRAPSIIQ
jgi:hypothetical protein